MFPEVHTELQQILAARVCAGWILDFQLQNIAPKPHQLALQLVGIARLDRLPVARRL